MRPESPERRIKRLARLYADHAAEFPREEPVLSAWLAGYRQAELDAMVGCADSIRYQDGYEQGRRDAEAGLPAPAAVARAAMEGEA